MNKLEPCGVEANRINIMATKEMNTVKTVEMEKECIRNYILNNLAFVPTRWDEINDLYRLGEISFDSMMEKMVDAAYANEIMASTAVQKINFVFGKMYAPVYLREIKRRKSQK